MAGQAPTDIITRTFTLTDGEVQTATFYLNAFDSVTSLATELESSISATTGGTAGATTDPSIQYSSIRNSDEPGFVVTITWTTNDNARVTVLTLEPSTTTSPSPSTTPASPPEPPKPTNTAAIAGGVVGGVVALALLGVCLFFLRRRRRKRHDLDRAIRSKPSVRAWSKPELHSTEHQPRREELQGSRVPGEMLEKRNPLTVSELPANEEVRRGLVEMPSGETGAGCGAGIGTTGSSAEGTEETLKERG